MNYQSEINSQVISHLIKYGLYVGVTKELPKQIANSVLSGNYAFQLIYDDTYQVIEWKALDRNLVCSIMDITLTENIFSYDGGKRFQWSERETLLIDMRVIREYKLNNILQ